MLLLTLIFAVGGPRLWAQTVLAVSPRIDGGWIFAVGPENVPGGPGGDVTGDYESAADAERLSISGCPDAADAWRVDLKKTGEGWDSDLVLYARVRSVGSGDGTVAAPDAYRVVTDVSQPFISGTGNRTGIVIQLKVGGISVSRIHEGRYRADLVYTVTELE